MAGHTRQAAWRCPAPIAIHDEGQMPNAVFRLPCPTEAEGSPYAGHIGPDFGCRSGTEPGIVEQFPPGTLLLTGSARTGVAARGIPRLLY